MAFPKKYDTPLNLTFIDLNIDLNIDLGGRLKYLRIYSLRAIERYFPCLPILYLLVFELGGVVILTPHPTRTHHGEGG